jgi:transposase/ribosomal protein L34
MIEWASAKESRHQPILLGPSLDEQLEADHGIRVLEAILAEVDWRPWEAQYAHQGPGRPAVHPRLMAGAILYGLIKRIRSTRELEEATHMRMDFRWLLEGRTIDHSTFAAFRIRFEEQIADLFKTLNRRAAALRRATLAEILIDGTRLRADSDRHGARTADALEKKLTTLEQEIRYALQQLTDEQGDPSLEAASGAELEARLARLDDQRDRLLKALAVARERDVLKQAKDGKAALQVRVPVTDPDAYVLPNKEGGYAPNYTPVMAVDPASGLIVGAVLAAGNGEAESVPDLMQQVTDLGVGTPHRVLVDGGFASGQNLQQLAEAHVEVYAPLGAPEHPNPAVRPDPTQPVLPEAYDRLPLRGGKLDRRAFVYDPTQDCYYCPMGRRLDAEKSFRRTTPGAPQPHTTVYRSPDCAGCPLAARCVSKKATARTVARDEYEGFREAVCARMKTEAGRAVYARRAPFAEGVFGVIKSVLGVRRFARRGRAKVTADWFWTCTAYNLLKQIRRGGRTPSSRPDSGRDRPRNSRSWSQTSFQVCHVVRSAFHLLLPTPGWAHP